MNGNCFTRDHIHPILVLGIIGYMFVINVLNARKLRIRGCDGMRKYILQSLAVFVVLVGAVIIQGTCLSDHTPWTEDKNIAMRILTSGISPSPTPHPDTVRVSELQTQIDYLNSQIELVSLENQSMSKEITNVNLQRQKVIKAISNNLGGVFKGKADYIYNTCVLNGVRPELMASIFRHETGNGTSSMVRNKNNPGGIRYNNSYEFVSYKSLDEGIKANIMLIKNNYIDKGRKDIRSIGVRYCPSDDPTDTEGLNDDWIPTVTTIYKRIIKESGGIA